MGLIRNIMLTKKLGHYSDVILAADKRYSDSRTLYLVSRTRTNHREIQEVRSDASPDSTSTLTRKQVKKSPQKHPKKVPSLEPTAQDLLADYRAHHPLMKVRGA